jgi:hypothetical protein
MAASDLEQAVRSRAELNRVLAQENLADQTYVKKPIGTFTGNWKGFTDSGAGLVSYKGRQYEVTILANSYARLDQQVTLTLTEDGNYAVW